MDATQKLFPTTRTERQIGCLGIRPWELTPAAVELFARRHRMHVIVKSGVMVPVLAIYAWAVWPRFTFPDHPTAATTERYSLQTGAAMAFFGLAMVGEAELTRYLDRRLATDLTTRVTRAEQVPWLRILGRVRFACLLVVLLWQGVMIGAFFAAGDRGTSAYCWGFLVAFCACAISASLGLTRTAHRPALAIDAVSLLIDERLRSEDAFAAISPIMYLALVNNGAMAPIGVSPTLLLLGLISTVSSYAMWFWAQAAKPWPKPGPAPWVVQPVLPMA